METIEIIFHLMSGSEEQRVSMEDNMDGLLFILETGYLIYQGDWYQIDAYAIEIGDVEITIPSATIPMKIVHITAEKNVDTEETE